MSTGYSGTPLTKKLGISAGAKLVVKNAPKEYKLWLAPLPAGVNISDGYTSAMPWAHVFVYEKAALLKELLALRKAIAPDGVLWISWPKKSSKVPTDITEDTIRQICLPLGFVDVKVCAVSEVWSGLKLMIRKELR